MKRQKSSAVILFLVGSAVAFSAVISLSGAPQKVASFMVSLTSDPLMLLLLINILLLIVGMFLDAGPSHFDIGPYFRTNCHAIWCGPIAFCHCNVCELNGWTCDTAYGGLCSLLPPVSVVRKLSASVEKCCLI